MVEYTNEKEAQICIDFLNKMKIYNLKITLNPSHSKRIFNFNKLKSQNKDQKNSEHFEVPLILRQNMASARSSLPL